MKLRDKYNFTISCPNTSNSQNSLNLNFMVIGANIVNHEFQYIEVFLMAEIIIFKLMISGSESVDVVRSIIFKLIVLLG